MPVATKVQSTPTASAILPLVLVFLCGIAVGALVMSFAFHGYIHVPPSTQAQKDLTLDRWKRELDLTPAQTSQIESILDDFARYYDNVLAYGNSRILQVLDKRQQEKFEHLIKDRKK